MTLEPLGYFFFLQNLYIPMKHHFENCFEDKYFVLPWLYGKKTLYNQGNIKYLHIPPLKTNKDQKKKTEIYVVFKCIYRLLSLFISYLPIILQ